MAKVRLHFTVILLLLLGSTVVFAAAQDPVRFLDNTTKDLISTLKSNRAQLKNDSSKAFGIVERKLVPKVDFVEMAKWVAGRNAWLKASSNDQQSFVRAFKILVIRTYAGTLNNFDNQYVTYEPYQGNYQNKRRVQVSSTIHDPHNSDTRVAYRLVRKNGHWQVYDIIIEGVSLIKGFQNQFSSDIGRGGLKAATQKIKSHNSRKI